VRLKETIAKYLICLNVLQVVPPDQARTIYKALKERGLPVALVEYEGEQHGFRKVEKTALITFLHLQGFNPFNCFMDYLSVFTLSRLKTSSSP
jgi:hypothetical protein